MLDKTEDRSVAAKIATTIKRPQKIKPATARNLAQRAASPEIDRGGLVYLKVKQIA